MGPLERLRAAERGIQEAIGNGGQGWTAAITEHGRARAEWLAAGMPGSEDDAARIAELDGRLANLRTLHADVIATRDGAGKAGWVDEAAALEWVAERLAKALGEGEG